MTSEKKTVESDHDAFVDGQRSIIDLFIAVFDCKLDTELDDILKVAREAYAALKSSRK
jgi:hypothetical protein